ncbi:hypothetical protein F4775DRAFT_595060 [Biscogniauxia sp. FL1348]|nr:hypothetical protein F4775DRAFT_595060 [Biscogniauxia sp. FL1348]
MSSFHEHWTNRGPKILMEELKSSGMWALPEDQRDVQGQQILAGGMNLLYEQWISRRRRCPTLCLTPPSSSSSPTNNADNTPSSDSTITDNDNANSTPNQEPQDVTTQSKQPGDSVTTGEPGDHERISVVDTSEQIPTVMPRDSETEEPQLLSEGTASLSGKTKWV